MASKTQRTAGKEERERAVFEEFAQTVGLKVIAGSIESRPQPEPDILCKINGRGSVAFELVELIDQEYLERTAALVRFDGLLRGYPNQLSDPDRMQFLAKYADAMVTVEFKPLRLRLLTAALPELFRWLRVDVPPDANSNELELSQALDPVFDRVGVTRAVPKMILSATSGGNLEDPTLNSVRVKLQKKQYTTPHPKELLAFTAIDLLLPPAMWQDKSEQPLIALQKASTFQKLWVFSLGQPGQPGSLKLEYPS